MKAFSTEIANSPHRHSFSIRSLLLVVLAVAVAFAYVAACERADRTPRTVVGRLPSSSATPISDVIVLAKNSPALPTPGPATIKVSVTDDGLTHPAITMRPNDKLVIQNVGTRGCCIVVDFMRNPRVCKVIVPGSQIEVLVSQAESVPVKISGAVRPDINGILIVTEFAAGVTNETGEYHLAGVLPGVCHVEHWHPHEGRLSRGDLRIPRFKKNVGTTLEASAP